MNALTSSSDLEELDANDSLNLDIYQTVASHSNQSSSGNETFNGYSLPIVVVLSTLLTFAMVMALVGNTLVILTILRNKDMRTRTNLLLSNLALADILVALLDIPVALYTIIRGEWHFSQAFCNFNGYFVGLGFMLSIHTLMWISIHKFISITKPFARALTPGKIFCMMVAAWAWSLLYNVGPLVGWTETVYKPGASQCGPVVPKTPLQLSHSLTNTIFNFIIPICVMSYCYYKIFAEVREHMNRLQEFADVRIRTTILQQRRISMTLFIVLLCFLLCWLPYILYSCTLVAVGTRKVDAVFNPIAYLAGYINSAFNPIIYALRSPSFRKGFEEILCGPKRVPESPAGGEQTFKWTRINGVVVSFRRSFKIRSKSSPNLDSKSKDESMIKNNVHKYSLAEPTPELKTFNQRRMNNKQRPKIKKGEPLLNEECKAVTEDTLGDLDELKANHQGDRRASSGSSNNSVLLRAKTPLLIEEEVFLFDEQQMTDKMKHLTFASNLHDSLPRWSKSAPDLLARDEAVENSNVTKVDNKTYLTTPETAYLRTNSVGDVKTYRFGEGILNPAKEPPHLVWQASVEEINFISLPKSQRSKSLWHYSREGSDEEYWEPLKTEQTHPSMRLGITGIISTVKRSIGDLFSASDENLDASISPCKKYQRKPSEVSAKVGTDSESSILIAKF